MSAATLTLADAARMIRDAVRDKSYRTSPLGGDVGRYFRWKRGRLTPASYSDYESSLARFAIFFADLELRDFEPPVGAERLQEFLEHHWGDREARTYGKNLSILRSFFTWAVRTERLHGDPTAGLEPPKRRQVEREVFSEDAEAAILASQDDRRDRVALGIVFAAGIRKGALQRIQFKHFDHARRRLTVFEKGGKVRKVPLVDPALWNELERLILDTGAEPHHYLLCRQKAIPREADPCTGKRRMELARFPGKPMGGHGLHNWWYGCLQRAGIVGAGVTSGERLHKARHTAGQRVLDSTKGNLKAVQRLLGHASIGTTADVYVDWDLDQLAETLSEVLRAREEGGS